MRNSVIFLSILIFIGLGLKLPVIAQTTGKISGRVLDADSREPLPGASVMLEGTNRGASADLNGEFFILNIAPGSYTLVVKMMGYQPQRITNLRVSVNRTEVVNIQLKSTVLEAQEVQITASRISIKKDQTSAVRNVSTEQMRNLPIENVDQVLKMQTGVVAGHFRGGRSNEVSYLIDGLQVDEAFSGEGKKVELEPEAIEELEVITGTFNAEYGRVMSGIVNAVTKDGTDIFHGSASINNANYFTSNQDIFIGLKNSDFSRNQDYRLQLSGPVWKKYLTFFTNVRFQDNLNYLNGIRRFNVDNYNNFASNDTSQWISRHTGDGQYRPLNASKNSSFLGKLTATPHHNLKISLVYTLNADQWQEYDHLYKYNPDGLATRHRQSKMLALNLNHLLSQAAFYELKISYLDNDFGNYVFENPLDARYVNDWYAQNSGAGFSTGGQQKNHERRTMFDLNARWDLTWQINKNHSLKTGLWYTRHDLDQQSVTIQNKYWATPLEYVKYEPVVFPDSSIYSDIYRVKPREFSAYLQDKIEFDEMVMNVGLRFDYFDPNTRYPSQLRNPANQLQFEDAEKMSHYPQAEAKYQLSPRLGLAYQLSNVARLYFSYGHFFQMPPMYAIFENHSLQVAPSNYATTMGNPLLDAQKTVQYEIGLWQELVSGMGIEVALFYRDIYDLLSATVITTYNQIKYGLYTNKDYGNAKGLEFKYNFDYQPLAVHANYTLQYTRGNADNPRFNFDRAGNSRDPIPTLIPMSWDQRHTLNVTVGYNLKHYGLTMTGYYDSGTPYTWQPMAHNRLSLVNLYPNNASRPGKLSVDLLGFYAYNLVPGIQLKLTLSVYNLFDRLNESQVYARTGRAYTNITTEIERLSYRSDFTDYLDVLQNPAMYDAPRMVKLGLGVTF